MQSWRAEPSVDAERQALLLLREEEGDAAHGRGEGAASDTAHRSAADEGPVAAVRIGKNVGQEEHRGDTEERVHGRVHVRPADRHQEGVHDAERCTAEARHDGET